MGSIDEMIGDDSLDRIEGRTATLLPDPVAEDLWCPIISVDDHVLEPPTLFEGRVPARFADAVPHQAIGDDGIPRWVIDGAQHEIRLSDGAAGRPRSEWNLAPQRYSDFREGVWNPTARLKDMDVNGIWAQLGFPSITWGFAGSRFARMQDPEVGLASLRAYNDWMLDEWCAAAPARYIPCQAAWLGDPHEAAREVLSNAERGFRAVSFSENPELLGFGSLYGGYWDPFFAACEATDTVINLHVGSSGSVIRPSTLSPHEVVTALFPLNGMIAVVDWIYSKIPIRFPKLQVVLSEAGISWIPMIIERLRRAYRRLDGSQYWLATDPDPVDLLRRNFSFTSIEDPSGFKLLDYIDDDRVMVEVDYPHADTTWPEAQAMVRSELSSLSKHQIRKVCYGNAAALYRVPEPPADWLASSVIGRAE